MSADGRGYGRWGFGAAIIAAIAEPFLFWNAFAGDAQVHLVFAENAAHGLFFHFNPGEPVAGETSSGYMLLGAVLFRLVPTWAVPLALKMVNLVAWYGLGLLVYRVARRSLDHRGWAAIAALVFTLMPGTAYNANIGMENGLFAAVFWLWIELVARWNWLGRGAWTEATEGSASRTKEITLAAILGVSCWLRPEGEIVAMIVYGFMIIRARPDIRRWLPGAILVLAFVATCLIFQFIETHDWFATSARSRTLMAARQSLSIGPLLVDPRFAIRLLAYWPITGFCVVALWAREKERSLRAAEALAAAIFVAFFVMYTFVTGAFHLARYTIFLVPILTIASAHGARAAWEERAFPRAWHGRVVCGFAATLLIAGYGVEGWKRSHSYSQHLLRQAMQAPTLRHAATDRLLSSLVPLPHTPVVLAYESVQIRYELDDRAVIRSLDGRVDPLLLACARQGNIDYITYLKRRHVDFLMEQPSYLAPPGQWSLASLKELTPGQTIEREGLRFSRLAGLRAYAVNPEEGRASPTP